MYFDSNPPEAEFNDNEFPSVDKVVSVANCWYYLSLLERFVDTTKDMSEEVLKLYLVRAEYRYFQWITNKLMNRNIQNAIPPVDVAFFWQTHMLSPLRYYEDTLRVSFFCSEHKIPLKRIHGMQSKPVDAVINKWNTVMKDEPYNLTKEALFLGKDNCALISCVVCHTQIKSPWKEYAEWRTDHTVALQCHSCLSMFTIKHVGKANLFANIHKTKMNAAGLLLDENGNVTDSTKEHSFLQPLSKTKALPFNRGLKPLDDFIRERQVDPTSAHDTALRKRITDAIQSTYLCTPYRGSSIDLIQAVSRQYKFAFKATKIVNWDSPQGIVNGIRNYSSFLALIKENPTLKAVPTLEIDLAWHTHMLHHTNYQVFTKQYVGKFVNHDDTIPESTLDQHVHNTDQAWKLRSEKRKEFLASPSPSPFLKAESSSSSEKKKDDIKSKFKSAFSSSHSNSAGKAATPLDYTENYSVPSYENGYVTEEIMFGGKYYPGTFISSPPYAFDNNSSATKDTKEKSEDDTNYDKQKISFHDKRDIKEFVSLKNSDSLMDQAFADVKNSTYGFIGTSNCANTDYLDQWNIISDDHKFDVKSFLRVMTTSIPFIYGDSKYTKVFLTVGKKPVYSNWAMKTLPKPNLQKHSSVNAFESIRYNSTGDDFNWYLISQAWGAAAATNNKKKIYSGSAGGNGSGHGTNNKGSASNCGSSGCISSCGRGDY